MGTSKEDIRSWFLMGKDQGASHMIIVCDSFSYEDYPVYVTENEDVRKIIKKYDGVNMQRVMEVYNFRLKMDYQLQRPRAFYPEASREELLVTLEDELKQSFKKDLDWSGFARSLLIG